MAFYRFKREQLIVTTLDVLWDFISSPENLKKITPDSMGFNITSESLPEKMYAGMIISYRVKPFPGIATDWVSEITHIKAKQYFVDEQRIGPFAMWHHEHILQEVEGGVKMIDIVSYAPPFGFLGRIANSLIIRKQLNKIFNHRVKAIEQIFHP